MADHVAPWEDEEGWTHSNCPNGYNFPDVVCHLSRYLGYPQCPEYIVKMVTENEEQVYQVFIYLTPHPDRVHMFQEMNPTLREAYEAVALAALTELCERHAANLDVAPVSYLPIHHQTDGPWRVQHQRMPLQFRTCQSTTRQMDPGEFDISACWRQVTLDEV